MKEWSLLIFTLIVQLCIGSFILSGIITSGVDNFSKNGLHNLQGKILIVTCVLLIIATLISLLHLGSPFNAMNVFNNLKSSWLSREILFQSLFIAGIIIYTALFFKFKNPETFKIVYWTVAIGGAGLLFSMSKLYMLQTVPAWNTFLTPVNFILTSFLLGIVFILFLWGINGDNTDKLNLLLFNKSIIIYLAVLLSISLVLIPLQLFLLKTGSATTALSYGHIFKTNLIIFWIRTVSLIFALALTIYLMNKDFGSVGLSAIYLLTGIVFISEILGRYLFYASFERVGL